MVERTKGKLCSWVTNKETEVPSTGVGQNLYSDIENFNTRWFYSVKGSVG